MFTCKAADARLLVPGRLVGSTDGQPWVVVSAVRTEDGVLVSLADITGEPAPPWTHFDPVPLGMSRFAALLRRYDPAGKFRNEFIDRFFPPG